MRRLLAVTLILTFAPSAFAAKEKTDAHPAPAAATDGVQTKMNFEDLLVQGKYHFSDESVTTVEEDKVLDALIGVRNDFKDRLQNSEEKF